MKSMLSSLQASGFPLPLEALGVLDAHRGMDALVVRAAEVQQGGEGMSVDREDKKQFLDANVGQGSPSYAPEALQALGFTATTSVSVSEFVQEEQKRDREICCCMDRLCSICSTAYVGRPVDAQPQEGNSLGKAEDSSGVRKDDDDDDDMRVDDWVEVLGPRVLRVPLRDAALRPVGGEGGNVGEQELVAIEVPLALDGGEDLGPMLDHAQLRLKGLLCRERTALRGELEDSEAVSDHVVEGTGVALREVSGQIAALEQELFRLKAAGEVDSDLAPAVEGDPELVLQTKTIPTEEVLRNWTPEWQESALTELHALLEKKKALREITPDYVDALIAEGVEVLRIPMKLVFTIKAITARKKCRIVLCGNQLPQLQETSLEKRIATYAGGVDIGLLRFLIADAVKEGHQFATWDVSTAFLNAPAKPRDLRAAHFGKRQVTVGVPPKALVRLGLVRPNTLWLVELAMYGLDTSPRDWGLCRNETLQTLHLNLSEGVLTLQKSLCDSSIWFMSLIPEGASSSEFVGWLAIYVDDFLGASREALLDVVFDFIEQTWECGKLEKVAAVSDGQAVRFNGLEMQWSDDRTKLYVHQASYTQNLLDQYRGQYVEQQVPLVKPLLEAEEPEEPNPAKLKLCQQIIGELLYLAVRSRPDLSYSCSRLAAMMVKRPAATYQAALGVIGYLAGSSKYGLVYTKDDEGPLVEVRKGLQRHSLLEVFTDAGFAPEASKSQEASVVMWRGQCVHWMSARQPFTAQSTCEAELVATVSGANLGESFVPLARELRPNEPLRCQILNDNMAAIGILSCDSSSWRTRHLKIRANALREKIADFLWEAQHVSGEYNCADIGTKTLQFSRLSWLRALLGMAPAGGSPTTGQGVSARVKQVASSLYALVVGLCVGTSEGARESESATEVVESNGADWVLVFLVVMWTISVIALWECGKCVFKGLRVRTVGDENDSDEQEPGPEPLSSVYGEVTAPPFRPPMPVRFPEPDPEHEVHARPGGVEPVRIQVLDFEDVQREAVERNQNVFYLPPEPPIRFQPTWPIPAQMTMQELRTARTDWGGNPSALGQFPPRGFADQYEYPGTGRLRVLIRWHGVGRVRLFVPAPSRLPVSHRLLSGRRRTIAHVNGTWERIDDDYRVLGAGQRHLPSRWHGRTEFEVLVERMTPQERAMFEAAAGHQFHQPAQCEWMKRLIAAHGGTIRRLLGLLGIR